MSADNIFRLFSGAALYIYEKNKEEQKKRETTLLQMISRAFYDLHHWRMVRYFAHLYCIIPRGWVSTGKPFIYQLFRPF